MKKVVIILSISLLLGCNLFVKKSNNNEKQVEQNPETEGISKDSCWEETFQAILQQLQIKPEECYLPFVAGKYFNELSCWVVPIITSMEAENPYSFSLACYVLLADRQTKEIVNKYYNPHAWNSSDIWRLTKISIEGTPYKSNSSLNISIYSDNNIDQPSDNTIKIFSVIAHYENSSDGSLASSEEISLFVTQDKSLKKIFDYTTKSYGKDNCNGYDEIEKHVFVSGNTTNGLYDIVMAIDSINRWFSDDYPDQPYLNIETDYKFFHYTDNKYEETTTLDNTIVHIERGLSLGPASPLGIEIYYCFGKTLAQAYDIWRGNNEYFKSELPKEDISYSAADENLEIEYKYEKNALIISIYDGHIGTGVEIMELDGYTIVSSSWSD